jgi:hypothetical protein
MLWLPDLWYSAISCLPDVLREKRKYNKTVITFWPVKHQKMCRFLESMWMMLYVWSLVNDLNHSWLLTIATMTLLISFLSQLILTDSEKMIIYMICFSVLLILSFGYALFINKKMKIPHYRHNAKIKYQNGRKRQIWYH